MAYEVVNETRAVNHMRVNVTVDKVVLPGELAIPEGSTGIVLFAHGSGSSRFSPRNQYVSKALNAAGLATLLFDLLTKEEEAVDLVTHHIRFDVKLLSHRIIGATSWLMKNTETRLLSPGYFGASTGAAAALIAAVHFKHEVKAVVSRGGRPDLAEEHLPEVKAPVLLIVGGEDSEVLRLNKSALEKINAPKKLEIISGATHLFEEPGALEEVARLAAQWFGVYL